MKIQSSNFFNITFYENTLKAAIDNGYTFITLSNYVNLGCPQGKFFILRLDLDFKPLSLAPFVEIAKKLNLPFTLFVRVSGPYNFLWYPCYKQISHAAKAGCEIGLHTSAVEWAEINNLSAYEVLSDELIILRSKFDVVGIAPHRDINYMFNTLPYLQENWDQIKASLKLSYHSYEKNIEQSTLYVNEGLSPHLGWRNLNPLEAIKKGSNIYMLLHPHWWFVDHAFELE